MFATVYAAVTEAQAGYMDLTLRLLPSSSPDGRPTAAKLRADAMPLIAESALKAGLDSGSSGHRRCTLRHRWRRRGSRRGRPRACSTPNTNGLRQQRDDLLSVIDRRTTRWRRRSRGSPPGRAPIPTANARLPSNRPGSASSAVRRSCDTRATPSSKPAPPLRTASSRHSASWTTWTPGSSARCGKSVGPS